MAGNAKSVSPIAACWTPLVPKGLGSGRWSIRVSGGRGDQPGYDAAHPQRSPGLLPESLVRFVGFPPPISGHEKRLSATPVGVLEAVGKCRGYLVPVGAFATAGYRGRLGREKFPKGTTPTPRGPSGTWARQGRLGREEPPCSDGGQPASHCRKPKGPKGSVGKISYGRLCPSASPLD
jgi:hypothetical protein